MDKVWIMDSCSAHASFGALYTTVCHISLIYFRNDTFYDGVYIFLSFVDVSKYAISIYQQIILLLDLFQNGQ
jgi:hypothetical protein